jgi:hypothetical protein
MELIADIYCYVWDICRAKYETREEKNEARRIALDKIAIASVQCDGIMREMEAR